MEFNLPTMFWI